jgi:enamine deaminase RidA (YjgF/YER057c/UK114 family)
MRQEYRFEGLPEPLSHYADAVRSDGLLFVSGVVGIDEANRVVPGGVLAQTDQIFRNYEKIFAALGGGVGFKDVLKVTVFLTDVGDRTRINPIRQKYFGDARPASTLIGIKELALPDLQVEIEAVVALPKPALAELGSPHH